MKKNKYLTQEELKQLLLYDHEDGLFKWRRNRGSVKRFDVAGCTSREGYRKIKINGINYFSHRLAWLYVYGYFPEKEIDHIDRNKTNNSIQNLREASRSCNMRNIGKTKGNKSGVKGVFFNKKGNSWEAYISIESKLFHVYWGKSFQEAVLHRLAAEQCLGWNNCESESLTHQYYMKHIKI